MKYGNEYGSFKEIFVILEYQEIGNLQRLAERKYKNLSLKHQGNVILRELWSGTIITCGALHDALDGDGDSN